VTLPHTVTQLSWGNWDPASWQRVWIYRRHFDGASLAAGRVFADFDHTRIEADGSDATRITFRATDAHGNQRRGVAGNVTLSVTGPADLIGDNPFPFGSYGPVGGAFVRSRPGRPGLVTVGAGHPALGRATVQITSGEPDRQ
jgi:beta-galactosidase